MWSFLLFLFLPHCAFFIFSIFVLFMFYVYLEKVRRVGFHIFLLHQMYYAFFQTKCITLLYHFVFNFLLLADLI